jgi:hypothetical protein
MRLPSSGGGRTSFCTSAGWADIENRNVVPSLHKLYSLAAILHLDPLEISNWYEAPFQQTFHDSAQFPPPAQI